MSYYPDQPPLLQSGNPTSPRTIYSPSGTGFVQRNVDPNSLVSNQLNDLLAGNSQYITQARSGAAQQAASRGLLNTTIASGAGEAAAINAGLPIATGDANTVGATDQANMDAENTFLGNQGNWNNQTRIANANLAASTAMARDANAERAREYDLTRTDSNAHYDTDWTRQIQGSLLGNALGNMSGMDSMMYQQIFSNPTLMNDPAGAAGMANFWQGQFGDQLSNQMSPEFLARFGITLPPGSGATGGTNSFDVNNPQPPGTGGQESSWGG